MIVLLTKGLLSHCPVSKCTPAAMETPLLLLCCRQRSCKKLQVLSNYLCNGKILAETTTNSCPPLITIFPEGAAQLLEPFSYQNALRNAKTRNGRSRKQCCLQGDCSKAPRLQGKRYHRVLAAPSTFVLAPQPSATATSASLCRWGSGAHSPKP